MWIPEVKKGGDICMDLQDTMYHNWIQVAWQWIMCQTSVKRLKRPLC
jgi:hypothetical protein